MPRTGSVLVFLLAVSAVFAAVPVSGSGPVVSGSTYYVDPSMSPGEIQGVLSGLSDGDTVVFLPGVYRGGFTVSGVGDIVIRGYGAVINASGNDYGFDIGNSGGGVVIEGFRIIDALTAGLYIHSLGNLTARDIVVEAAPGSVGVLVRSLSDVRLFNVTVHGHGSGTGIYVRSAGDILVINVSVTGLGTGVYVGYSSSVYIYGSLIRACGTGVYVENAGLELIYSVVEDNDLGVKARNTGSLTMYFNRFIGNGDNADLEHVTETAFTTGEPIKYLFNGREYRGVVGNYWGGVECSDTDGDGVGEKPVLVDNESGTEYYDTAPICPRFMVEPYRVYFSSPGTIVVEAGNGSLRIPWRPGENASFTAKATAWYVFEHPVLGRLSMKWPATMILVNLSMTEIDGIRVASTARLINYSISENTVVLVFRDKGYVAVASPRVYAAAAVYGNGSRRTLRPVITGYMGEPWGLVEVGDPVNVTLYMEPIPAPEPPVLPVLLLIVLLAVMMLRGRRGRVW